MLGRLIECFKGHIVTLHGIIMNMMYYRTKTYIKACVYQPCTITTAFIPYYHDKHYRIKLELHFFNYLHTLHLSLCILCPINSLSLYCLICRIATISACTRVFLWRYFYADNIKLPPNSNTQLVNEMNLTIISLIKYHYIEEFKLLKLIR